jgi:hypothetical protein
VNAYNPVIERSLNYVYGPPLADPTEEQEALIRAHGDEVTRQRAAEYRGLLVSPLKKTVRWKKRGCGKSYIKGTILVRSPHFVQRVWIKETLDYVRKWRPEWLLDNIPDWVAQQPSLTWIRHTQVLPSPPERPNLGGFIKYTCAPSNVLTFYG